MLCGSTAMAEYLQFMRMLAAFDAKGTLGNISS